MSAPFRLRTLTLILARRKAAPKAIAAGTSSLQASTPLTAPVARPATTEVVLETTAPVAELPDVPDLATAPQRLAGTEFPLLTVGGATSQSTDVQLAPVLAARGSASP